MNVKVFLAIAAAIAVVYGIAFITVPDFVQATYGMTSTASSILAARYFGLTLLGLGLVTWLVRETSDQKALRGLLSGLAIQSLIGALVSIWGTTSGTMNGMGWSAVLIYAVLLAGYVYYLFADRTVTGRA
jgi:uncharacterized protein YjeT (DUF2065 family)